MSRSPRLQISAWLLCLGATALSTAHARDIERLSAAGSGGADCPAEVAAAKAEAADESEDKKALIRSAKPAATPVRGKPSVRGADVASTSRLQAPRWHSFLPGMFR